MCRDRRRRSRPGWSCFAYVYARVPGRRGGLRRVRPLQLVGLGIQSAVKSVGTREGSPLSTNEDETDPSTPSARRSNHPEAALEGTDPGVGEPVTEPTAVPARPLGIV